MEPKILNKISTCKNCIATLSSKVKDHEAIATWFKHFCGSLSDLLLTITHFIKNAKDKYSKSAIKTLMLYLSQIVTLLSLLIQVFLKEYDVSEIITEGRYSVSKQLILCLDGIKDVISHENVDVNDSGSFLKWMDLTLDKVAEVDINYGKDVALRRYDEAHSHVEEVLCYAMSIAQVACGDNCKSIKGSSQSVLDAMESLHLEINKSRPNVAMCNLSIDSCYDKLCALERKVNTAVLNLSLKVFSEYVSPLEKLCDYCFESEIKFNEEIFDNLVADFDLHVDRIMQIGLFAVAASSVIGSNIKMESCLASLEALEGELVPSLNAVILDRSIHNINYAKILKDHWVQQAECLKILIYLIIDPFAICQVTYEELKQIIENIHVGMKSRNGLLEKELLDPILSETKVLLDVIKMSVKDMQIDNTEEVESLCGDVRNVLHEIKSAANVLIVNKTPDQRNSLRVFKRCKILLTVVKKLLLSLADDVNNENKGINIGKDQTKIINKSVSGNDDGRIDNKFLNHIINRGKEIIKDRSVLYKTPVKTNTSVFASRVLSSKLSSNKPMPLRKAVHLRNLQFSFSRVRNETSIDLQITGVGVTTVYRVIKQYYLKGEVASPGKITGRPALLKNLDGTEKNAVS